MAEASQSQSGQAPTPACDLKGRPFTLTVLRVMDSDPVRISADLDARLQQLPGFFDSAPLVIELMTGLELSAAALHELLSLLRERGLHPVALNGGESVSALAVEAGLCVLNERPRGGEAGRAPRAAPERPPATRVVKGPVRSGRQVTSEGDLVVLGAVGDGAEVLAAGHVHIYGEARGRVLAGLQGDTSARIFCQSLEAELISVAGFYRSCEALPKQLRRRPVQVWLEDETLRIEPI